MSKTTEKIEEIAEKWADRYINTDRMQITVAIHSAIAEATDHLQATIECHELVAPYKTIAEGINAIKSTAPTWTKELPKEVHKCTPITEYATRTTPVKIKCIECGREL
jgi:hypothetical protein